jgi:hypothetical protein
VKRILPPTVLTGHALVCLEIRRHRVSIKVKDLTQQDLEVALDPVVMLYQALLPALQEVGRRFEVGDFFVPEMLMRMPIAPTPAPPPARPRS